MSTKERVAALEAENARLQREVLRWQELYGRLKARKEQPEPQSTAEDPATFQLKLMAEIQEVKSMLSQILTQGIVPRANGEANANALSGNAASLPLDSTGHVAGEGSDPTNAWAPRRHTVLPIVGRDGSPQGPVLSFAAMQASIAGEVASSMAAADSSDTARAHRDKFRELQACLQAMHELVAAAVSSD
jgi:hypothetical protein